MNKDVIPSNLTEVSRRATDRKPNPEWTGADRARQAPALDSLHLATHDLPQRRVQPCARSTDTGSLPRCIDTDRDDGWIEFGITSLRRK